MLASPDVEYFEVLQRHALELRRGRPTIFRGDHLQVIGVDLGSIVPDGRKRDEILLRLGALFREELGINLIIAQGLNVAQAISRAVDLDRSALFYFTELFPRSDGHTDDGLAGFVDYRGDLAAEGLLRQHPGAA